MNMCTYQCVLSMSNKYIHLFNQAIFQQIHEEYNYGIDGAVYCLLSEGIINIFILNNRGGRWPRIQFASACDHGS
jgi:hypothetical protein